MSRRDLHSEQLRYLIVGFGNTALSYGEFWLAIRVLSEPLQAATGWDASAAAVVIQWTVWVLAVVQSTATMKYLVFRSKGRFLHEVVRAYGIYLPAQGISTGILFASMRFLGLGPLVGQAIAVFVTTIFSYLGHKYFTFRMPVATEGPLPENDE